MPELPEVETIVRGLRPLIGLMVTSVERLDPKLTFDPDALVGSRLVGVERRGKYILLRFEEGMTMIVHLRMSGRLVLTCAAEELPYVRMRIGLDRGVISFVNPRRLGTVDLCPGPFPHELGVDPLCERFTPRTLETILKRSSRPVKLVLTDQRRLAGLGNIYVAEALWRAGIAPWRRADRIARKRIDHLHQSIIEVLQEAIAHSGTSIGFRITDYRTPEGEGGAFRERLAVYGHEDDSCPRCGSVVARSVQAGRSTYWCPRCQR
jgi:formamidopyrimidine-DNA glycosylase